MAATSGELSTRVVAQALNEIELSGDDRDSLANFVTDFFCYDLPDASDG